MIKWTSLMLGFGLFFGATTALAQSESRDRFRVGARLGFAVPFGDLDSEGLRHSVKHQVPVALEAGYMVTPQLMIGAYGQYGSGATGEYTAHISISDLSFGAQAQYHPLNKGRVDPWLGVGAGYEILKFSSTQYDVDAEARGFEIIKLQGGVDLRLAHAFALGPFLSYSIGEYENASSTRTDTGQSTTYRSDIAGTHEWLTAGVKGTFAL